jgi:glycosyltransferase involved in cell wall biosynthesis
MPVYNAGKFLAEAIESVLSQTWRDFELIIINDGSLDRSASIIDDYAARDPRVVAKHQDNRGLPGTLNRAIEIARAPLLARMDADDHSAPDRLEAQVAYLADHPDVVAVGGQIVWMDPEGLPLRRQEHPLEHEEIERLLLTGNGWAVQHAAAVMRRAAVLEVGGYREDVRYSEDLDLFLRLLAVGRLGNIDRDVYFYRQHPDSICQANRAEMKADHDRIMAEAFARRGMDPPADERTMRGAPLGKAAQHRRWGWWALNSGYRRTARKHAVKAVLAAPRSRKSWQLAWWALVRPGGQVAGPAGEGNA